VLPIPDAHPAVLALYGTTLTWALTVLGAGPVFLRREYPQRLLDAGLGFAAGVMLAASYFSLSAERWLSVRESDSPDLGVPDGMRFFHAIRGSSVSRR
jgi:zinc transporter ZupT